MKLVVVSSSFQGRRRLTHVGGALIPGLHDHHIHLMALAASRLSVRCGLPEVGSETELRTALTSAPGTGWIRGVGYHELVAGMLDRETLDEFCGDRPVRIQHRSGKMWFLNSLALKQLGLEPNSNGQLFRDDALLRERLDHENTKHETLDVEATSALLASYGVTGITDATHSNSDDTARLFGRLSLSQHVMMMGDEQLPQGPLKIMLDDYDLPEIDAFRKRITGAHERNRPVAVHCVTRTELVYAVSTFLETGTIVGDRIEHASVTDDMCMELIARVWSHGGDTAQSDHGGGGASTSMMSIRKIIPICIAAAVLSMQGFPLGVAAMLRLAVPTPGPPCGLRSPA